MASTDSAGPPLFCLLPQSWQGAMTAMLLTTSGAVITGALFLAKLKTRPQRLEDIPAKMKALLLVEADADLNKARLEVVEVDTPKPRPGQVLVKMAAAPINPSDDGEWRVPLKGGPKPCGNEGSGVVVASGGGLFGWWMLGKKVAVVGTKTYMQYACTSALAGAFSVPSDVPVEDACAFFVNPFTVVGIVETVKERGAKAFIHTAAASSLGQMMVKYCKQEGVTLVNVVRRPEQVELLKSLGADLVVDTSRDTWKEELADLIKEHKIRVAFDAVAGNMTGELLQLLPPYKHSVIFVYGRLASEPVGNIQPLDLIYRGKRVEGWILTGWLQGTLSSRGPSRFQVFFRIIGMALRYMKTSRKVGRLLSSVLATCFKDTRPETALADYNAVRNTSGITGVKMRIRFDG